MVSLIFVSWYFKYYKKFVKFLNYYFEKKWYCLCKENIVIVKIIWNICIVNDFYCLMLKYVLVEDVCVDIDVVFSDCRMGVIEFFLVSW